MLSLVVSIVPSARLVVNFVEVVQSIKLDFLYDPDGMTKTNNHYCSALDKSSYHDYALFYIVKTVQSKYGSTK